MNAQLLPEGSYAWAREKLTPKFSKRMCLLQDGLGILQLALQYIYNVLSECF